MIPNRVYDGIRFLAQILLPAVGTLIFLLEGADTVVGVILVAVFVLGIFLWMSQRVYANRIGYGDLIVEEHDDGPFSLRLALEQTPEELVTKREVRFFVVKKSRQEPEA